MEFLRQNQLSIMLFLSGSCCILAILSFLTKSMPKKRRMYLVSIQLGAAILLMMDRYAYIFRGDLSQFGWWAVRISNFMVFFLSLFLIYFLICTLLICTCARGIFLKLQKGFMPWGFFLPLGQSFWLLTSLPAFTMPLTNATAITATSGFLSAT